MNQLLSNKEREARMRDPNWFTAGELTQIRMAFGEGHTRVTIRNITFKITLRPNHRIFISPVNGLVPCLEVRVH